jgi:TctA family transporter
MKGVTPGPMLFEEAPQMTNLIFCSLIAIALMLQAVGSIGLNVFALVAKVPSRLIGPITAVLILTGVYSYQTDPAHLTMALLLGLLGYFFEKLKIPTVPLVLAFIMGRSWNTTSTRRCSSAAATCPSSSPPPSAWSSSAWPCSPRRTGWFANTGRRNADDPILDTSSHRKGDTI